ncbi:putative vanillate O-demethylase oxidoreductase [Amylocarpus encephaloides]|uniref:Vanillate O-demethylase oxidoreductase n=1 Tax=Amylocarpus encephaloides TaxID=45428 RepID=A0A9P8C8A7_9HELO|nr:putative vanillate O-demethylase oxidoreductase [Amylocarpus encephaloides]
MGSIQLSEDLDRLQIPWQEEILSEVRTGKGKTCFGFEEKSAIYKTPRKGPVKVTKLGCESDEQIFEFHGGPEKALLQYSSLHYDVWKSELPQSAPLFNVGGFGENLVSSYANERNVCIGDIIQIGSTVKVQVTLPRQPCYKLNHRFQVKDMSRRSQELKRTGWFYRVLVEGYIEAGDKMTLLERLNPNWTIANVQHYLYIEMRNFEVMAEIAKLEGLGAECRNILQNRLNKNFENQASRLMGNMGAALETWMDYRLVGKRKETSCITSLAFEAVDQEDEPTVVQPGSHVKLQLGGRLNRAYSVMGGTSNKFELGVSLDRETSRGGSLYIHDKLKTGDIIPVSKIVVSFPLSEEADYHVLIAGGIGITAFLAAAKQLQTTEQSYHLHYLVRNTSDIGFSKTLQSLSPNVTIHDKSAGNPFNPLTILSNPHPRTHIYTCGSPRLTTAIKATAASLNICPSNLHFEAFAPRKSSNDPFQVEIASSCTSIEVPGGESLLDVLRNAGFDVQSSCEVGNCGSCKVGVMEGRVDEGGRGNGLRGEERVRSMLACIERGVGRVVLDL